MLKKLSVLSFLLLLSFTINGCGLYSSEGRKDFDTDVRSMGSLSFYLKGCQSLTANQIMLRELSESPLLLPDDELIFASTEVEVWKRDIAHQQVLIRSKKNLAPTQYQFCDYILPSEDEFLIKQDQLLKELINTGAF